jgi:hypothetical protein
MRSAVRNARAPASPVGEVAAQSDEIDLRARLVRRGLARFLARHDTPYFHKSSVKTASTPNSCAD